MTTPRAKPDAMNTTTVDGLTAIAKAYGPYAFGLVTVLVLWLAVLRPELDRKNDNFELHRAIIEKQIEQGNRNEDTARTLKETAVILDRVTLRLESLAVGKGLAAHEH